MIHMDIEIAKAKPVTKIYGLWPYVLISLFLRVGQLTIILQTSCIITMITCIYPPFTGYIPKTRTFIQVFSPANAHTKLFDTFITFYFSYFHSYVHEQISKYKHKTFTLFYLRAAIFIKLLTSNVTGSPPQAYSI